MVTDALSPFSGALAEAGLGLVAMIPVSLLRYEHQQGLPAVGQIPRSQQSLLVIGNTGPRFWEMFTAANGSHLPDPTSDPVDKFSIASVTKVLQQVAPDLPSSFVYPSDSTMISLQELGRLAGWHQSSPLGIGMHPEHGLWFAYRAVVLLDLPVSGVTVASGTADNRINGEINTAGTDICMNCDGQPCLSACPASALAYGELPDMNRCSTYRLVTSSQCVDRCLARNACPAGAGSRYPEQQIRYHYSVSLASIRQFVGHTGSRTRR